MEIAQIYYKAKDGRLFTDPLQCEDYEKSIGIIPGSVGDIIRYLEKNFQAEQYVHGLVFVREADGSVSIYSCSTVCCDGKLDLFTNPESLTQEQRYIKTTVGNVIEFLKGFDKDLPMQYMLTFSKDITMQHPGVAAFHNPNVWPKKEEEK